MDYIPTINLKIIDDFRNDIQKINNEKIKNLLILSTISTCYDDYDSYFKLLSEIINEIVMLEKVI